MDQDSTLRLFWEGLFHADFPFPPGQQLRGKDIQAIKQRIMGKLREISSTDKDRSLLWRKLKTSQEIIRERDAVALEFRARLLEADSQMQSISADIAVCEDLDRYRIWKILPDNTTQVLPRDTTKDQLFELLASYVRSLEQLNDSAQRPLLLGSGLHDVHVLIAERDAALAEVRVLQARLSAVSSVPGPNPSSPNKLASSIALNSTASKSSLYHNEGRNIYWPRDNAYSLSTTVNNTPQDRRSEE